jgi:hypothetical protein
MIYHKMAAQSSSPLLVCTPFDEHQTVHIHRRIRMWQVSQGRCCLLRGTLSRSVGQLGDHSAAPL